MSRRIDVSDPTSLSAEDEQYLADRNRTVDEERENQEELDRIEGVVELDADQLPHRLAYMRRVGGPVFGDPGAYGPIRKAGQL